MYSCPRGRCRIAWSLAILLLSTGSAAATLITIGSPAGQTSYGFENTGNPAGGINTAVDLHITLISPTPPTFLDPPNVPQPYGVGGITGFDRASVGQDAMGRPQLTLDILGPGDAFGLDSGEIFNVDFSQWPIGTLFDVQYSYPPPVGGLADVLVGEFGFDDSVTYIMAPSDVLPEPATFSLLVLGGLLVTRRRR